MKRLTLISICISTLSYSQSLYQKMESIRRHYRLPEMGYAVISSQQVIDVQVCGYHRIDQQTKVDTANIKDHFHLGSNTKAITGFIAAYLVEQGKIKWDTKFFDLYPEMKKDTKPAYYNITLQQLLSHRAGIQPFTSGEKEKAPKVNGTRSAQRKAFAKYVLEQPPVPPDKNKDFAYSGEGYVYSNAGYSIASLMLEKVTGKSWEQLVREIINYKLQLKTNFGWPNETDSIHQPWGHWVDNDHLVPLSPSFPYHLNLIEPAGDINMSLPDYSVFIQLQLQGLKGNDRIISAESYKFLHFGIKGYSIGWLNGTNKSGKRYSAHEGSAGTFHVITVVYPDDDRAYIICINAESENTNKAKDELLKYLQSSYNN